MSSISDLRQEYTKSELLESQISKDPIEQFQHWFEVALHSGVLEPNAMTLSTVGKDYKPTSRIVLLKEVEKGSFVFFTNYDSRKGQQIHDNPWVSLNFWWDKLERQVHIQGIINQVSHEQSETYFKSRPRASQLGAWASNQSEVIPDREFLEKKLAEVSSRFEGTEIPMPPYWGGYRVTPVEMEFWQGRSSRLHDRIRYKKTKNDDWKIERLSP